MFDSSASESGRARGGTSSGPGRSKPKLLAPPLSTPSPLTTSPFATMARVLGGGVGGSASSSGPGPGAAVASSASSPSGAATAAVKAHPHHLGRRLLDLPASSSGVPTTTGQPAPPTATVTWREEEAEVAEVSGQESSERSGSEDSEDNGGESRRSHTRGHRPRCSTGAETVGTQASEVFAGGDQRFESLSKSEVRRMMVAAQQARISGTSNSSGGGSRG
mmetsp:Transcript_70153/g.146763  ORF Transcript_70153/g.146763 Transcript_70153/m.146763 type:complete len:220 (-) Transcript_70153:50-709(-)